jgi:NAD(P)H-hydrate epimerase
MYKRHAMKTVSLADIPSVDTAQMIEVDRAMVEDMSIELIQMMENAGRNLAHLARLRFFDGDPRGRRVLVFAGGGGNGGGALVAARRLHNWGANVRVGLGQHPSAMTPIPAHQRGILEHMGVAGAVRAAAVESLEAEARETPFDLIIDGLIGYSLKGAPTGLVGGLISLANRIGSPILALDAPSGIDTATGRIFDPAIRATATMTLALPKSGLLAPATSHHVGELYLADISVPPDLYSEPALGLSVGAIFAEDDVVRLK